MSKVKYGRVYLLDGEGRVRLFIPFCIHRNGAVLCAQFRDTAEFEDTSVKLKQFVYDSLQFLPKEFFNRRPLPKNNKYFRGNARCTIN